MGGDISVIVWKSISCTLWLISIDPHSWEHGPALPQALFPSCHTHLDVSFPQQKPAWPLKGHWDFFCTPIVPLDFANNDIPTWGLICLTNSKFPFLADVEFVCSPALEQKTIKVINSMYSAHLALPFSVPSKPGAVGTLCWCFHCSQG